MRAVSVLALLIAIIALAIAGYALTGTAASRTSAVVEDSTARTRADELSARLDKLQQQLDAAKAAQAKADPQAAAASKPVTLDTGNGTMTVQIAAGATPADDDHIRKIVNDELQAQMQKMRAQFGGGPGGQPQLADAASVKTQLGVDDQQKADQAAKIIADMRSATRDVWRGGGDRDANMKKMQDLRTEAETKLADVLTPEQLTKAKELLDQGGGRRRGGPNGGGPGANGGGDAQPAPAQPPKGTSF